MATWPFVRTVRRVWKRKQPLAQVVFANPDAPHPRVSEEEALIAGEVINDWRRLAVERMPVRAIRHRQPCEIADVLGASQRAVHAAAFGRAERVELRHEQRGPACELALLVRAPPVADHGA